MGRGGSDAFYASSRGVRWVSSVSIYTDERAQGRYGGVMQKCLPPREILPHFADQAAGYPILGPRVGYSCLKALKVSLEQDKIGL